MTSAFILNQQRVLVADDERIIADTLQIILSMHGFEVVVAYDGKAAIEKARQFNPQIVLCDLVMPNMNGMEAAIQIRAIIPDCRVFLSSALTDVFDLVEIACYRGHEFEPLLKPVHPEELLDRLRSLNLDAPD